MDHTLNHALKAYSGHCHGDMHLLSSRNRCNYMALLERLDSLFADLIAALQDNGQLANTIVCVSSDHGEMLGDHNVYEKSRPWEASVAVPLICSGPGIQRNVTVIQPVSWVDLSATFLDLAQVVPWSFDMTGADAVSLLPFLATGEHPKYRSFLHSGLDETIDNQPWRAVITHESVDVGDKAGGTLHNVTRIFKYICCQGLCSGAPSTATQSQRAAPWMHWLTEVTADPFDMHNMAAERPALVQKLQQQLAEPFRSACSALVG